MPAGPQGATKQGLRLLPALGSESAEWVLCSSLFFINELLEVPAESCSLRGWAGLPRVPILKLPSLPAPLDECGPPQPSPWAVLLPGLGPRSSWNVFFHWGWQARPGVRQARQKEANGLLFGCRLGVGPAGHLH